MSTLPFTLSGVFGEDLVDGTVTTFTLEHILDYADRAKTRMLQQYKKLPNIEALTTTYAAQLQTVEDALWDVFEQRSLAVASGIQLDVLGRILGLGRQGMTDTDYRAFLSAQTKLLASSGTLEQIYEILALAEPGATLSSTETYPAAFTVLVSGLSIGAGTAALLATFVRKARPAGVYAITEWQATDDSDTFLWDTADQGWDDGYWAGAIVS